MNTRLLLLVLALASFASPSIAEVRLPAIISDHMVLQNGVSAPIWGWASPDEMVTVRIGGQSIETKAGADGKWRANLAALPPGGPHILTIGGTNQIEIKDVLVGEVWLGSGQSNMAMTVKGVTDAEKEIAAADLPHVRVFTTASQNTPKPAEDCSGHWKLCSPETAGTFSATAFFFGREIHRELKVPVGLIVSAVGGTPIDSWVDEKLQRALPDMKGFFQPQSADAATADPAKASADYEAAMEKWKANVKRARADKMPVPRRPQNPAEVRAKKSNLGGLFNGMIMPLVPYAIRGALWYQGEANSVPAKAPYYQHQLPLLVTDWRQRWDAEFPFAWVQLPNFAGNGRDLPQVREGMLKTLRLPKTGMAVTIDIGEAKNIHPKNKQEVGRRLSLWALQSVYGRAGLEFSGPLVTGHEVRGGEVIVHFSHAAGLKAKEGGLVGFQIAGEDQIWQSASARVDGSSVIVSGASITKPVAVRYAWENDPACNLINAAGLPASPFRTDDWKLPAPVEPSQPVKP